MTHLDPDYEPRVSLGRKNAGSDIWYLFYYLPNGIRLNHSARTKSKMLANARGRDKESKLLEHRPV